jgi:hypothetical protein
VVPDLVASFDDRSPPLAVAPNDCGQNEERRPHVEALEDVEPSA